MALVFNNFIDARKGCEGVSLIYNSVILFFLPLLFFYLPFFSQRILATILSNTKIPYRFLINDYAILTLPTNVSFRSPKSKENSRNRDSSTVRSIHRIRSRKRNAQSSRIDREKVLWNKKIYIYVI